MLPAAQLRPALPLAARRPSRTGIWIDGLDGQTRSAKRRCRSRGTNANQQAVAARCNAGDLVQDRVANNPVLVHRTATSALAESSRPPGASITTSRVHD